MKLSYDIISEFVKITNNNKEKPKEGIVYATIVNASNGKYVKIDGSDLLTPTDTTTDIEDGERVTVMIKDHKATVTGNVTSPSASSSHVNNAVGAVTEKIGVFENIVADKVDVNELIAYKAVIEELIANKATIKDLEAINATIENLKVKNAEIENLVADKATIKDLEVINATIENLKVKDAEIENATIENLEATKAEIGVLTADFAQIKTLVSGNLTSENILSFNITSDKVTVADAFIKDAMIDTISAAKINAGQINTSAVTIGSADGGMLITGATQQFRDKNGKVRIQIGRDASGDFTFILYGKDGKGQIINQNGITSSAIGDGLIVNNMINNNAAISGSKLDISSVITKINEDNSTTINSNKIYLDERKQSLEVAFNSLKTKVDTIQDVSINGTLTAVAEKVQSNTTKIEANTSSIGLLIAEDTTIKKQVTDLENNVTETTNTLSSKYASLNQSLDGFKTTVSNTYATKNEFNDSVTALSTRVSTAEQKITSDAIIQTVTGSSTYKNNLTGKVDKNSIISSINQTAEAVKIDASKIELTGNVVVNAINKSSTTINGNKITTGTITADMITSGTFQGTNFIAGGSKDGHIEVKDSSNNVKFYAGKKGIYATTMVFPETISSSGAIVQSGSVYADSNGFMARGIEMGTLYRTERTSKIGLSGVVVTEQDYDISGGGNVPGIAHSTKISGYGIDIDGIRLTRVGNNSLVIDTPFGNVKIGPQNDGWCHFYTDRPQFWFQKNVHVNGEIYAGSEYNKRVYHEGFKPSTSDIGAAKAFNTINGYPGLTHNDGSTSEWIRATSNGFLPYKTANSNWNGANTSIGTLAWRFDRAYIKELITRGLTNDLGDLWLTAKAGANTIYAQSKWLCPASNSVTYLGSSGYRWHSVWSTNGNIQTSDERFKVKRGFANIDDCFDMIRDVKIYNYVMLDENKEELSKKQLGKLAMKCEEDDAKIHIGVMAQDLQQYECGKRILVEDTYEKEDGTTESLLSLNSLDMTMAIMGALKKEIEFRENDIKHLRQENDELKIRLTNIEALLMSTSN